MARAGKLRRGLTSKPYMNPAREFDIVDKIALRSFEDIFTLDPVFKDVVGIINNDLPQDIDPVEFLTEEQKITLKHSILSWMLRQRTQIKIAEEKAALKGN